MARKFKIKRDYYEEKVFLYKKRVITINPGVTVLVGCNGIGKTTLIQQMFDEVKKDEICFLYSNTEHTKSRSIEAAVMAGDMGTVASSLYASEGELTYLNIGQAAHKISKLLKNSGDKKEVWLFFDSVDSGFSADNVVELKGLFDLIIETNPDKEVYIIVSTNSYEMTVGEQCFDTVKGKYVNIKSYDRFKKVVMESRKYKDGRDEHVERETESNQVDQKD